MAKKETAAADAEAENVKSKYSTLTANFMRGAFKGQLASAFKASKSENSQKAADFISAIRAGDIAMPDELSPQARRKLLEMGLEENELPAKVDGEGQAAAADATLSESDEAAAAEVDADA